MKVEVLDKGHVEVIEHMGSDLTVANSARVSFATHKDELDEKDEKLIKYLADHNHWTPFAHPQITLRIKAPISIRTQFFKHKQGFVENEISRRYVSMEPEFYHPKWRTKPDKSKKQGSGDFIPPDDDGGEVSGGISYHPLYRDYEAHMNASIKLYEDLIIMGVAPEQARFCLPQGMYTEWYWTGSLAAYARFYKLRIHPHAQWEIRQYAEAVSKIIEPLFPISWSELTK